jgi:hypothetical protein
LPILACLHRLWRGGVSAETAVLALITRICAIRPSGTAHCPTGTAQPWARSPARLVRRRNTPLATVLRFHSYARPEQRVLPRMSSRPALDLAALPAGIPGRPGPPAGPPFPAAARPRRSTAVPSRPIPGRVPTTALPSRSDTPFRDPHDISRVPVPLPPILRGFAMPGLINAGRRACFRPPRPNTDGGRETGKSGARGRGWLRPRLAASKGAERGGTAGEVPEDKPRVR